MNVRRILVLGSALAALCLTSAGSAFAAKTAVALRIEGVSRTLLPTALVVPGTRSITKGGTPANVCPATTAAGALDVASFHDWDGTYGQFGLSVTSILGESHPVSATSKYYWSIWVDDRYAPAGICGLKLHTGEDLLFAAVPDAGTAYPVILSVPQHATTGHPFKVKAFYYKGKQRTPAAHATVAAGSLHGTTNAQGIATLTPSRTGEIELQASGKGYIRSVHEPVIVTQ
jgi:hypothetical protein